MAEHRREGTLLTTAAQIIVRIRAERELSMSSLAVLAGVPTSTISRIESGQIEPTLGMIRRIALGAGYHLHLQYYDLFSGRLEDDAAQVRAADGTGEGDGDEARGR
ncbi:helix-turn-helix domain-containing protein [Promicromonospora soli]|uniref:helix-turn-helix domain-containing protein n=1 Tax=Promicromonospora soli TaxID=2035533 RepID=UPI00227D81AC|nr:helix-turn-helix transcriptional regulator [Promicromonospora soli]